MNMRIDFINSFYIRVTLYYCESYQFSDNMNCYILPTTVVLLIELLCIANNW